MKYEGFRSLMSQFSDLTYQNCVSGAKPDYAFIEEQLIKDFTESDTDVTEWTANTQQLMHNFFKFTGAPASVNQK